MVTNFTFSKPIAIRESRKQWDNELVSAAIKINAHSICTLLGLSFYQRQMGEGGGANGCGHDFKETILVEERGAGEGGQNKSNGEKALPCPKPSY